jgi:putative peptidoglycan lipid II flippase
LTIAASVAGWIELVLLRGRLNARLGPTGLPISYSATLWFLGIAAAAAGWRMRTLLPAMHPAFEAAIVLGLYGALYLAGAALTGVPESGRMFASRNRD